ncbi:3'-5' exonuclease [Phaeodactylibacter luteus]|uniref:3'-5' exonuclease n=1 Tax=Phaeodactylibacter luteus TaxID=1564516 RepID=A0A5C6RK67_9BACT|nr:3'-5' exonuclease [Phaeodactylibacter luteus]TXB62364.1 3'-5' exonuclease [Phaeodactylibacter luteus]
MQLSRPIIFFDLETTGVHPENDRIVQIGAIKMSPNGETEEKNILVNPEMPIPPQASAVHGISDEMVAGKPVFRQYAKSMFDWFSGADLAGYNAVQFDIPMLAAAFRRCGLRFPEPGVHFVDVLLLERHINSHRLEAAYERYTGAALEDAHDAMADIRATLIVLQHQLKKFPNLPISPEGIAELTQGGQPRADISGRLCYQEGVLCWNFGKHRGQPVADTPSYASWFLSADFPEDAKEMVREAIQAE